MEITHFFEALWQLSIAMAPYILFGLLFAGILHELVPDSIVTKHLGKDNITSVVKSTVFGIPLPVCSCGVIPLATSIKNQVQAKVRHFHFLSLHLSPELILYWLLTVYLDGYLLFTVPLLL